MSKIKNNKRRRRRKKRVRRGALTRFLLIILLLIGVKSLISNYNEYKNREVNEVNVLSGNYKAYDESDDVLDDTFTVCIDPGHGDWDVGTIGISGAYEKDIVLDISLQIGELLESEGINVVYTRTDDNLTWSDDSIENLYERVQICEDSGSDIFISIHCNSSAESSEYRGVETWYNSKSYDSEVFATIIQEELSNINYTDDRGIKFYDEDEPLAVLNNNTVPATLVELGFISNWSDENYLTSKYGQATVAEAICDAILNYKSSMEN